MVILAQAFKHLKTKQVLVLGDFMCDLYTRGKATRVSPEAPVVVLHVEEQHRLAGGAGNVVFNLKSLGAEVFPVGLIGDDDEGNHLLNLFQKKNIPTDGIFQSKSISTIVKNRMIAEFQQLLRVDFEKPYQIDPDLESKIIEYIEKIIPQFDVVAISDYQKGFLSKRLLACVIQTAKKFNIPVVVDPKGDDFSKYHGATIIKPNSKEAYIASKSSYVEPIQTVAKKLLALGHCQAYVITRSEHGMAFFSEGGEELYFPVQVKEVVDVTGAGDTALAMITFCLANSLTMVDAIPLANIASSIAIEKIGCAHVSLSEVASRLLELDLRDKYLSIDQLEAFKLIIKEYSYTFFFLEDMEGLDFQTLENLKNNLQKTDSFKKIVYCKKNKNSSLLLQILGSYPEVDYVLFDRNFVENLLETALPTQIVLISKDRESTICKKSDLIAVL